MSSINQSVPQTGVIFLSSSDTKGKLSLAKRKKLCLQTAQKQGIKVLKVFIDTNQEKKSHDRRELLKLLEFCSQNKGEIHTVLTYCFGELSSTVADYLAIRKHFEKYDITISSATEPILPMSTDKFVEIMLDCFKQLKNDLSVREKTSLA